MAKRTSIFPFVLFLVFGPWSLPGRQAGIVLGPSPAFAADFTIDAMSIGQVRKTTQNTDQIPVNGYLGATVANPEKWNLSEKTNMRVFRDFDEKTDKYDLYQTTLHLQPAEMLKLDLGRQFVNQGFSVEVLDGIQTTVSPAEHFYVTAFSGIPRSLEISQFQNNKTLLTGLSVGMTKWNGTTASLHGAWQKNNIDIVDFDHNDEVLVGANMSHQFQISMTPMVYGAAEYDTSGKLFQTGTGGFDIYPTNALALNLEFNYFNVNRALTRKTIEGTYSTGRLLDGRFSTTLTLVPRLLKLVENYSYENIQTVPGSLRSGHRLEAGLQCLFEDLGLRVEPAYYFVKSFGGHLNGAKALFHEQFNDRLYADLTFDFAVYKKITNDNDNATSVIGWTGYEIFKNLVLSGGFEYNKNNLFDKDARGSFRLDYHFDNKS